MKTVFISGEFLLEKISLNVPEGSGREPFTRGLSAKSRKRQASTPPARRFTLSHVEKMQEIILVTRRAL
jgi:hypothetical protein